MRHSRLVRADLVAAVLGRNGPANARGGVMSSLGGAKRNPGAALPLSVSIPDFASLNPGYILYRVGTGFSPR
jgi:hypothetical protein